MTVLLQGLLTATAVGALLTLALLALTPLVGRRFAPQWRHWAWLFVALRLAVPVHISLPQAPIQLPALPAGNADMLGVVWVGPSGAAALPPVGGEGITPQNSAPASNQAPAIRPFDWQAALLALWALGGAGFLGTHLLRYAALARTVRRRGHYVEDYEGLPVWVCPELPSPVLMGFVHPKIVLPPDLTEEVRRFTLLHEATHHRRRDLWFKLLLVWCNALHWFNPVVWLFRRAAAGDLELACDAALLRGRDEDYRRAYGAALVDRAAAGGRAGALTSAFSGTRGSLRRRVIALLDMRPRRAGRLALCLVCGAALLGGSLVACQSWSAPASQSETIRAMVSFDRMDADLESPPTELYYTPIQVTDPVTGTGYYSPGTEAMASLPIAADAVYPGFPTTLPNSDVPYHPGVVLRMKQMLSSQLVTLFPAVLTLEDGVVTSLAPMEKVVRLEAGQQVAFLDAPADEDGLVPYRSDQYGFSLRIPETTARRLAVFTALGSSANGGPAVSTITFVDRRLIDERAAGRFLNRQIFAYMVLCYPLDQMPEGAESLGRNERYWFHTYSSGVDRAILLAGAPHLTEAEADEMAADRTVMEGLTLESWSIPLYDNRPVTDVVNVALRYVDEDARLLQGYRFQAGGAALTDPFSLPIGEAISIAGEDGTYLDLHALAWQVLVRRSLGPAAALTLEDGVVTAIRLISWPQTAEPDAAVDGDTLLSNFNPEALTAVWMEPSSGINWWRLDLSYSFLGPGLEDLGRKDLSYHLEFAEDSPLLELMGINPFEGQSLGVSVSFLTGRNSMTEAEFRRLLSGDTSCTLVVTSAESGAQRRFSMAVSPDKSDGWALLRAYDQGSQTVTLDPIDEFMGGEGVSVYNWSTTGYTYALAPNAALSGEGLTGPADLSDLVYRPESPTPYLLHYQLNEMGQVALLTAQSRTHVSQPAWLGGLEGDTLTFYLSDGELQPDLEHPHSLPLAPGALEDPEALADQITRSP